MYCGVCVWVCGCRRRRLEFDAAEKLKTEEEEVSAAVLEASLVPISILWLCTSAVLLAHVFLGLCCSMLEPACCFLIRGFKANTLLSLLRCPWLWSGRAQEGRG